MSQEKQDKKQKRGFALLSPERRAAISRMGGEAAHAQGKAYEWTKEKAAEAGRLGGYATHKKHKAKRGSGGSPRTRGEKSREPSPHSPNRVATEMLVRAESMLADIEGLSAEAESIKKKLGL